MGATYIECSAKEQRGVAEVFELAINTAIQVEDEGYEKTGNSGGGAPVKGRRKVKKRTCKIL
jgi:Ras homolog gene family, member A